MNESNQLTRHAKQVSKYPQTYQIKVHEWIDADWSDWLDGLVVTHDSENHTLITGPVSDQSALLGLLLRLHNLGLQLVSVNQSEKKSDADERG